MNLNIIVLILLYRFCQTFKSRLDKIVSKTYLEYHLYFILEKNACKLLPGIFCFPKEIFHLVEQADATKRQI